jgi:hypothetical protein
VNGPRLIHYYSLFYAYNVKIKQVLQFIPILEKKTLKLCLLKKKKNLKKSKEFLNKFSWPKILSTNTLNNNVHKMYECDKN